MLKTKIAIFTQHGQDLIVVPLDGSFNDRAPSQRAQALKTLKSAAMNAGLAAPVAIVWRAGSKQYFIAPDEWHPFLEKLSWSTIISRLCAVLVCPMDFDESSRQVSSDHIQSGFRPDSRVPHTLRIVSTPDSARNLLTASH